MWKTKPSTAATKAQRVLKRRDVCESTDTLPSSYISNGFYRLLASTKAYERSGCDVEPS